MTTQHLKHRALIVDDSFLMRSRLARILAIEPRIEVIDQAEDGQQALEMLKEAEYDLILLDIEMPRMNGMEFLKRSKLHSDAKIIVLSSVCQEGSAVAKKAEYFGAFDVAPKPKGLGAQDEILHRIYAALQAIAEPLSGKLEAGCV